MDPWGRTPQTGEASLSTLRGPLAQPAKGFVVYFRGNQVSDLCLLALDGAGGEVARREPVRRMQRALISFSAAALPCPTRAATRLVRNGLPAVTGGPGPGSRDRDVGTRDSERPPQAPRLQAMGLRSRNGETILLFFCCCFWNHL